MPFLNKPFPLVVLLTDFGLGDSYVGVMKGVILSHVPAAQFVDLTHGVPPQDVRQGAFQLFASYRYFQKGTIFLCVVDPSVGSERRILFAEAGGGRFLSPDNGLLSWVLEKEKADLVIALSRATTAGETLSRTFHGRDVFAPLVGRLLNGEKPTGWGQKIKDWVRIPYPLVKKTGSRWIGEILSVDGFGNLITNVSVDELKGLAAHSKIWIHAGTKAGTIRGLAPAYSSVPKGKLLAIAGSAGTLEISVREGSAARKTGLHVGDSITLHFKT